MFFSQTPHPHPLMILLFLLADLFPAGSFLGIIGTCASILAAIVVSIYYALSLSQKRKELKQTKEQNLFQQMVEVAEARALEIQRLRDDITRLQKDIEQLQQQLAVRGEENAKLLNELSTLRALVHNDTAPHARKTRVLRKDAEVAE